MDVEFANLVRRVRAGDAAAAEEIVRRFESAVRVAVRTRLLDSRLRRQFDSMDICQSVLASFFVRAAMGQYEIATPDDLLKLLAQMALRQLDGRDDASPFEQLSERELQIAIMVVNCAKVQEIADKLHLSPKTVNSYRYRIFEKLDIGGDVELTRLAIQHGLIDLESIGQL